MHANRVAVLATPATPVTVDEQLQAAVAKGHAERRRARLSGDRSFDEGDDSTQVDVDANLEGAGSGYPRPAHCGMFGLPGRQGERFVAGRKTVRERRRVAAATTSPSRCQCPSGAIVCGWGVADASGHVGSIDAPVTAELDRLWGPFLTSADVMSVVSGLDGKPRPCARGPCRPRRRACTRCSNSIRHLDAALPADMLQCKWSVDRERLGASRRSSPPRRSGRQDRLTAAEARLRWRA